MENLKLYEVRFVGMWPVGSCLIILAKDLKEAKKIAKETIKHTDDFEVNQVKMDKSKVVVYLDGNY